MAAKGGPVMLRKLMERARGRDTPGRVRGGAVDSWPARYSGQYLPPYADYGLYAPYPDPVDETERELMTEEREIMGLDPESGY